ncbi:MAG: DUF3151 family protein [Acidimicrobiales bacterium]
MSSISFGSGAPETVLEPPPPDVLLALADAQRAENPKAAMAAVAASYPRCLQAWASLAEGAQSPIERYAFARVGYHRGLDALRAAGWKGSGFVRWEHETNRGFLRCLEALREAAAAIAEGDEEARCAVFLRQLDPAWPPAELTRAGSPPAR